MSDKQAEAAKSEYERNIRGAERAHDLENEIAVKLGEAAIRDAQEVIKAGLLINGGAAIAIFAFMGALAAKGGYTLADLRAVRTCLYWFTGEGWLRQH